MTREEEATPPAHNQAQAESIRITVNGEERRLPSGTALSAFLEENDVPTRFIAVAVNQEVVRRDEHRQIFLQEGDVVEIVRMVGGGSSKQDDEIPSDVTAPNGINTGEHESSKRPKRKKRNELHP